MGTNPRDTSITVINRERFHANCKQLNAINDTRIVIGLLPSSPLCVTLCTPLCHSRIFELSLITVSHEKSRVAVFEHAEINGTSPTHYASLRYRGKYILMVNISDQSKASSEKEKKNNLK